MQLKLQVTNDLRERLGARYEHTFGSAGGTIGRAAHNDWVLPDPKRYVSSVHASIEARDGGFYLVDTSMNGVYVDGSREALGPAQPLKLTFGTRLRMGNYRMIVAEVQTQLAEDQGTLMRSDLLEDRHSGELSSELSVELLVEDELAEKIDLEEILDDRMASANLSMISSSPFEDRGNFADGQTNAYDDIAAETVASDAKPPAKVHRLPSARRSTDLTGERRDVASYRAMLRGLGLDPATLEARKADELSYAVGKALRATIEGLKLLRQVRAEARRDLGLTTTQQDLDDLTPTDVTDDLVDLLLGRGQLHSAPADNIAESMRALRHHEQAVQDAALASMREVLDMLEPDTLKDKLEALGGGKGLFALQRKASLWEHFCSYYEAVAQVDPGGLPPFLRDEFARAYNARLQTLDSSE